MVLFPWLFGALLLLMLAEVILLVLGSFCISVKGRCLRLFRPSLRAVLALTIVELLLVLVWGLYLRPG